MTMAMTLLLQSPLRMILMRALTTMTLTAFRQSNNQIRETLFSLGFAFPVLLAEYKSNCLLKLLHLFP